MTMTYSPNLAGMILEAVLVQSRLQAWPGGHWLKETECTVQVRSIQGMAENQKSECTGGHSRSRWDILMNVKVLLSFC
jgi:hypothetical protein